MADFVDVEVMPAGTHRGEGGAIAPSPGGKAAKGGQRRGGMPMVPVNAGTPRSNLQDGGYFDATKGKRKPIYFLNPAEDKFTAVTAARALLSCFRHHPFWSAGCCAFMAWGVMAVGSFGLNFVRTDTQSCQGSLWRPAIAGCQVAAAIKPTVGDAAGGLHELQLGQDSRWNQPVNSRTKFKAVEVE